MNRLRSGFRRLWKDILQKKAALLLIIVYLGITQLLFHTVCPLAILFGVPCPACGLTRAGFLLMTGHFTAAYTTNAAIFLWAPFLVYLIIFRYFVGKKPPFAMTGAVLICLATIAYYVLRLAQGNPVEVPWKGILLAINGIL